MEGKMKNLEPAFSIFKLSARGKLKDNKLDSFKIIGHVRYNYGGELWDEWSAVFGDLTQGWIAEREGQCFLFTKGKMTAKLADIERLRVGNTIKIDNHPIFITQIRQATLVGGEGEFSYRITPDSVSKHLHGISEGKPVFIEIAPKYLKFHLGTNLDYKQIELIK